MPDYPGAFNGLQVESRSPIERIAAATDASLSTIEGAAEAEAQLLLVHHGLFWGDPLPLTGVSYRRVRALLDADMALYSAHLPLDVHPEVGNNVLLARALDLSIEGRFGRSQGDVEIGVWAAADLEVQGLQLPPPVRGRPGMSVARRRSRRRDRGPPFVEIGGRLYLNAAFDLPPLGADVRVDVAPKLGSGVTVGQVMVLRLLTPAEAKVVREVRMNADVEAWAKITA